MTRSLFIILLQILFLLFCQKWGGTSEGRIEKHQSVSGNITINPSGQKMCILMRERLFISVSYKKNKYLFQFISTEAHKQYEVLQRWVSLHEKSLSQPNSNPLFRLFVSVAGRHQPLTPGRATSYFQSFCSATLSSENGDSQIGPHHV